MIKSIFSLSFSLSICLSLPPLSLPSEKKKSPLHSPPAFIVQILRRAPDWPRLGHMIPLVQLLWTTGRGPMIGQARVKHRWGLGQTAGDGGEGVVYLRKWSRAGRTSRHP